MNKSVRVIRLVRNVDAGRLLDTFLLTSVVTVLVTRVYLYVTGYPQVGGSSSLHVSHLLPGGLLMLAAIMLMLASINRSVRNIAAFLGGIGFGLFWDELGKFITKNNNYFFQPAAAMIYVTFVAFYLLTRLIVQRPLRPSEYLANALNLIAESTINDLDPLEYEQAKKLLSQADSNHPLYKPIQKMLEQVKPTKDYRPFLVEQLVGLIHKPFRMIVTTKWFRPFLLTLFYAYGAGVVGTAAWVVLTGNTDAIHDLLTGASFSTNGVAATSALLSAAFVVWGTILLHLKKTHFALKRFETALLINIFVTQTFLFLRYQFWAVIGLAIALFVLFSVRLLQNET